MILRTTLLVSSAVLLSQVAQAQDILPMGRERMSTYIAPREAGTRIQVRINLFVPGPTGAESAEAEKVRERARRAVYAMAQRECDVINEVLAKECRLETLNVNVNANRNPSANMPEGYQVNGAMAFRIVLKDR